MIRAKSIYRCPHCGRGFNGDQLVTKMIPTHDFPVPCRSVCPGSGQNPRSIADKRRLGKDEK